MVAFHTQSIGSALITLVVTVSCFIFRITNLERKGLSSGNRSLPAHLVWERNSVDLFNKLVKLLFDVGAIFVPLVSFAP